MSPNPLQFTWACYNNVDVSYECDGMKLFQRRYFWASILFRKILLNTLKAYKRHFCASLHARHHAGFWGCTAVHMPSCINIYSDNGGREIFVVPLRKGAPSSLLCWLQHLSETSHRAVGLEASLNGVKRKGGGLLLFWALCWRRAAGWLLTACFHSMRLPLCPPINSRRPASAAQRLCKGFL